MSEDYRYIDRGHTPRHTKEELNAAAVAAQGGGADEIEKLRQMMRPYVISMTKKYSNQGIEYNWQESDDIKQQAWSGVWIALPSFDPDKGTKFSTWAHPFMRNEIHQWMARNSRGLPLSKRSWITSIRVEEAFNEAYPGEDIFSASDETLAALQFGGYDDKAKLTTAPNAGDLIRAKKSSFGLDPDFDGVGSTQSAEDDHFEVSHDPDADALATLQRCIDAKTEEEAWTEALNFIDRHGLPTTVAENMMEARP